MTDVRGLPLLSGPPPALDSGDACRKCNKEFNIFINRSRKCNHCGYLYCHNCSDYQAMMPRSGTGQDGYDPMHVCAFCIEFLNITAAGRGSLKTMPLSKLKKYIDAYNIRIDRAVEKDDLIEAIVKGRNTNGCLSRENENYYRKYSVPNRSTPHRSIFSRSGQSSSTPTPPPPRPTASRPVNFARPDLAPDNPHPQTQYQPPPGPPPRPHYQRPTSPSPQYHHPPPPQHPPYPGYAQNTGYSHPPPPVPPHASRPPQPGYQPYQPYQRPYGTRSSENLRQPSAGGNTHATPNPRPRAASATPPAAAPPPTLEELLELPTEAIGRLSIGALKAILFTNHVNAGMILEKGELVTKVQVLVEDERRERERQRAQEEAEEAEMLERQRAMLEEHERAMREREERLKAERDAESAAAAAAAASESARPDEGENASGSSSTPPPLQPNTPPRTPPKPHTTMERQGLCVICQDDEANIAIVDCGHLAMCRGCSDLVMASSRECPLCRTRIITEARLLRIFKT